jgi:hypothetical protein
MVSYSPATILIAERLTEAVIIAPFPGKPKSPYQLGDMIGNIFINVFVFY